MVDLILGTVAIVYGGGQIPPANYITGLIAEMLLNLGCTVYGVHKSFMGMADASNYELLDSAKSVCIKYEVGTYLGTCRGVNPASDEWFERIYRCIKTNGIHTLIIPGGDGSSRAMSDFYRRIKELHSGYRINILFIPCTIDGIEGSETIGLDSAVELTYKNTLFIAENAFATHRPQYPTGRVAIVETQGRNRNDISYRAVKRLAKRWDDDQMIYIPAAYPWSFPKLLHRINSVKREVLVVIPEGAKPIENYWEAISGKTPGAKIETLIKVTGRKEVNLNVIGYLGQTCDVVESDKSKCEQWVRFLEETICTLSAGESYALALVKNGDFERVSLLEFAAGTTSDVAIPLSRKEKEEVIRFLP